MAGIRNVTETCCIAADRAGPVELGIAGRGATSVIRPPRRAAQRDGLARDSRCRARDCRGADAYAAVEELAPRLGGSFFAINEAHSAAIGGTSFARNTASLAELKTRFRNASFHSYTATGLLTASGGKASRWFRDRRPAAAARRGR